MAACDNLYGNRIEWNELYEFFSREKPEYIENYMRKQPSENDTEIRICYIADIQKWLIKNCPLKWVQERLNENFDVQRIICGKAHHENINEWKNFKEKPEDDKNYLVCWKDHEGKFSLPHRAYYIEEEQKFFSLENNNSHPLHVDIYLEISETQNQ